MTNKLKKALIIGVNGQDGSYLAELLLGMGYQVTGWVRKIARSSFHNLCEIRERITLIEGDLYEPDCFYDCLSIAQPDEIYNLAAPSRPYASWDDPVGVSELAGVAVARLLEEIRQNSPQARFYQASSSEMFGIPLEEPQSETTPFNPRNPYGVAKLLAHQMVQNYARNFGLYAVSGILFNHESPRRGFDFVTRKITLTAAAIRLGMADSLQLGDLDARRDWGYAPDYVKAMWMMLQRDEPETFVIGSGVTHSVRDVCELAFDALGLNYRDFVTQDPTLVRPKESRLLVANPAKAKRVLGWKSEVSFEHVIQTMVQSDFEFLRTTSEFITSPLSCAELQAISLSQI
jgi:GDPmannose 4,6-dehydratase